MEIKEQDRIIWETYYDEYAYTQNEIDFFKRDKQEFLVSKLGDEDRKVESVSDKEIEEYFENDYYIAEYHFEYFRDDLEYEFGNNICRR